MKIFRADPSLFPICLAFALTACAGETGDYPSLLPRPVEQRGEAIDDAASPPPAAADAATTKRLSELMSQAQDGDRAFSEALPAAERAVAAARNTPPASENWVEAQRLISILDSARVPTTSALASLDELFIQLADGASRDATIGGVEEAAAARSEVEQLTARQSERLEALRRALS